MRIENSLVGARTAPFARRLALGLAALSCAVAPASAQAADPYYERAFVLEAHARCALFRPDLAAALDAAARQARGAALRAGVSDVALDAAAGRARGRAAAVSCADPELATVKRRVEGAFAGWSRVARMEFEGGRNPWTAVRLDRPGWRLSQASVTGASPVIFGLDERDRPSAAVSFVGRPRPYGARIVLRDASKAPRPWPGALPPEALRRAVWAAGSEAAPATLLAEGRKAGEVWRFPAAALQSVAALDPREPFFVEFLFRDGSVARAEFKAGDVSAGQAFLAMGRI